MPLKDLPTILRPREKALRLGISELNDIELLAIFLRSGNKNYDVLDLSKEVLKKFSSLQSLKAFNVHDLMQIKGIGKVKALEIIALFEFANRLSSKLEMTTINNHREAILYAKSIIKPSNQEQFLVVLLDQKNQIIYHEVMYKGTLSFVTIEPFRIIGLALSFKAKKFYCFHNHPSGNNNYSLADTTATMKIAQCARLFDLVMVDHIIL